MSLTDLEAVKQNGLSSQYVKEQTNFIWLEAVKHNGLLLQCVKEQTNEICLEAVKQDCNALKYVKEQTNEICLEAVKQSCETFYYVKKQTKEICLEAVKQNGLLLQYVKKQTKEICLEAVKSKINSLIYVNIKYIKPIYRYLKSINFKNVCCGYKFIINKDLNEFINYEKYVPRYYTWGIKYFKQTLNLCKLVIDNNYHYGHLSYINYKKLKLCLQIIKTFNKGFQYINKQYTEILL